MIDSNGVLVNNDEEYRDFINKQYDHWDNDGWKKAPIQDIYKTFGKPKSYPVVLLLRQNRLDAWQNK